MAFTAILAMLTVLSLSGCGNDVSTDNGNGDGTQNPSGGGGNGGTQNPSGGGGNGGTGWTTVTDSNIGTAPFHAIAYGNGKFVIGVSLKTSTSTSTDGITWTSPTDNAIGFITLAIAYGNGKFVAGGASGKIAYSSDGATWTAVTDADKIFSLIVQGSTISTGIISGIAWGNGNFVAGGDDGYLPKRTVKIATSPDGITWTAVTDTTFINGPIVYGNGKFISWGEHGILAYSADGITFQRTVQHGQPKRTAH